MTEPITVDGIFEAHLTVSDLDRSVAFYRDVVGLPLAMHDPELGAAFFWIGGAGKAMLGLWAAGSAPITLSLHVAFATSLGNVLDATDRLKRLGVTPLSFSATETNEPSVIGWMPAAAVYFRDPDGHLLEYLAMLDAPPDPEAGIVSWSDWCANRNGPLRARDRGLGGKRGDVDGSDERQIGALMKRFFRAVSFKAGDQPAYSELPALFTPYAKLIRTSGPTPEIASVDEFVRARRRAVEAGELTSFDETELAQTTELFGNVAHRFSSYAKRGATNHGPIDTRGAISTQLIRTGAEWRISSMAWDDERDD